MLVTVLVNLELGSKLWTFGKQNHSAKGFFKSRQLPGRQFIKQTAVWLQTGNQGTILFTDHSTIRLKWTIQILDESLI